MKRSYVRAILCGLCLLLVGCAPQAGALPSSVPSTGPEPQSPLQPSGRSCSFLKPGVSLVRVGKRDLQLHDESAKRSMEILLAGTRRPEEGQDYNFFTGVFLERDERLAVSDNGGKLRALSWPSDLTGLVDIKTPEEALEFVRLFSSGKNWYLTPRFGYMEIHPSRVQEPGAVSPEQYELLHLKAPVATQDNGRFRIRRLAVSIQNASGIEPTAATVAFLDETVWPDGKYEVQVLWERKVERGFARLFWRRR